MMIGMKTTSTPPTDMWSLTSGEKVLLTIGIVLTLVLIGVFVAIIRMAMKEES